MKHYTKLELGSYKPILFHGFKIYKPTLAEIDEIGFDHFAALNSLLVISEDDLLIIADEQKDISVIEINPYKNLLLMANTLSYFLELKLAFFTYFKRDISITNGNLILLAEKKTEEHDLIFNAEIYEELQTLIRLLNHYETVQEYEFNSNDTEHMQKFIEARKKLRLAKIKERRRKELAEKDNSIGTMDIIFALATMSGYTIKDIYNLTVYQLFALFEMYQRRENYLLQHAALCAGAKGKLKYWIN